MSTPWTVQENAIFEAGLAEEGTLQERLERIANRLQTKTLEQVQTRYNEFCLEIQLLLQGGDLSKNTFSQQTNTNQQSQKPTNYTSSLPISSQNLSQQLPISQQSSQQSLSQQVLSQQALSQQQSTSQPISQPISQQSLSQQSLSQPISQPISHQSITQQALSQQPITQQALSQQPITQQTISHHQPTNLSQINILYSGGISGHHKKQQLEVNYCFLNLQSRNIY